MRRWLLAIPVMAIALFLVGWECYGGNISNFLQAIGDYEQQREELTQDLWDITPEFEGYPPPCYDSWEQFFADAADDVLYPPCSEEDLQQWSQWAQGTGASISVDELKQKPWFNGGPYYLSTPQPTPPPP